jgi:hypothetical protein
VRVNTRPAVGRRSAWLIDETSPGGQFAATPQFGKASAMAHSTYGLVSNTALSFALILAEQLAGEFAVTIIGAVVYRDDSRPSHCGL